MEYLFRKSLESYEDWVKVYQSIDDFKPLIQHIYSNQQIHISSLTPGTNAVFKVNDQVIKIFAPESTNINYNDDFETEIKNIQKAKKQAVLCPNIIDYGTIHDKYDFQYLILEYIEGADACDYLRKATKSKQIEFVETFYQALKKLQIPENSKSKVITHTITNFRLNQLNPSLKKELIDYVKTLEIKECFYVHGDLNGQNIRVNENEVYIIDFADSIVAPIYYDDAVIVFDLLKDYPYLIRHFISLIDTNNFESDLFNSLCIHDYGADFITLFYENYTHQPINQLSSLVELKQLLHQYLSSLYA